MQAHASFWLMKPFSTVFNLVFAGCLLLLTAASLLLRKKSEKARKTVLLTACAVTVIGFFLYKYFLSMDSDFAAITADMGGFNWWGELPLQLCNINMILIPIAVLKDSRPLKCFCFFLAPLGALMALLMPANGFDGYSLLLPRMLGYYGNPLEVSPDVLFILRQYGVFILFGLIFSTPIMKWLKGKFENGKLGKTKLGYVMAVLEPVSYGCLFLWGVSFLVLGSHNPFIYFNF